MERGEKIVGVWKGIQAEVENRRYLTLSDVAASPLGSGG